MTESVSLESGTLLENRYKVERLLAEGETTRVYSGTHIGMDLPIVIKQLRCLYPDPKQASEQIQLFQVEAKMLARLKHPNLVLVYDTFSHDGIPIMVMEMVEGSNLDKIGSLSPNPLEEPRILEWAEQLLETLDFLHNQHPPVIVRGLQPSNIVLDNQRRLRLIDFGLAKSMDDKGSGTRNIVKGLGEDGFASLEQGAYSKTDARSDIYSLGATLYYLLTKKVPPSAPQRVVAPEDPLQDPRALNPTVSDEMWEALQKMMELRPNDRPSTAKEAAELLPQAVPENRPKGRFCVDCKQKLVVELVDGVEIDRCESCGGLWLDKGELELLRERMERHERMTKTIALDPNHPSLKTAELKEAVEKPFWSTITRLLGRS